MWRNQNVVVELPSHYPHQEEMRDNVRKALEAITDWQACELLGVPVKLLDTAGFRQSLKPQDFESVK
jgi:hypothetical protein